MTPTKPSEFTPTGFEQAQADPHARANRFAFQIWVVMALLVLCVALIKYILGFWLA